MTTITARITAEARHVRRSRLRLLHGRLHRLQEAGLAPQGELFDHRPRRDLLGRPGRQPARARTASTSAPRRCPTGSPTTCTSTSPPRCSSSSGARGPSAGDRTARTRSAGRAGDIVSMPDLDLPRLHQCRRRRRLALHHPRGRQHRRRDLPPGHHPRGGRVTASTSRRTTALSTSRAATRSRPRRAASRPCRTTTSPSYARSLAERDARGASWPRTRATSAPAS